MYHQFKQLADIDITKEPMEVGPTTHYIMGGVRVDAETQMSSVPGLFAAGECAAGINGANRLGGNSLSDLLVFGRRAGEFAAKFAKQQTAGTIDDRQVDEAARGVLEPFERGTQGEGPYQVQYALQEMMQDLVGIVRNEQEMQRALDGLTSLRERSARVGVGGHREYNPGWHVDKGPALAFAITVDGGVGNSLQLYDTTTGVLRTLDSSARTYSGLAWRKESTSLAALRSAEGSGREGPTHTLLVWTDVVNGAMKALEPSSLQAELRVVRFRAPQWSEDGAWVFVGVGPWHAKASADGVDRSRRIVASSTIPDELPDVQVWHPKDTIVMPRQKLDARRERERSMLAAFSVGDGRLVRIAQAIGEEATPIKRSSACWSWTPTPLRWSAASVVSTATHG